jgi:hypothetical protein
MTEHLVPAALALLAGFAAGLAYFAWLWRSVRGLEGQGAGRLALGSLLRAGALAALVAAALLAGLRPVLLLPAGLGFLAARMLATRLARAGPPWRER